MINTSDFMPVAVAAQRLGIRRSALYAAIQRGHFHPVDVYGSSWVSADEIEAYRRYTQPNGEKPKGRPRKARVEP